MSVVVPDPDDRRPLLIFLHGKGGDEDDLLHDEMLDALAAQGIRAPVVAFPDGGEGSYWHDRDSGDWQRYLADEVPAQVAGVAKVDLRRIAVGGISMGGFGALALAQSNGSYCAAGAHSPAIWTRVQDTAPGAFDDAQDFVGHDVITHAEQLGDTPVWVDIGADDPFLPGTQAFGRAAGVKVRVWPGGHDGAYWRSHWDEYLRFYADALWGCDTR